MDFRNPAGPEREPAINLPREILVFILVIVAIQGVRGFLDSSLDLKLVLDFGFIPAEWSVALGKATPEDVVAYAAATEPQEASTMMVALARYILAEGFSNPISWLSYALLHGSWAHVGMNSVWLAAFGSPVVRRAGFTRSLLLAIVTALGGALAQFLIAPLSVQPMIGASAIVSGFMAAAATFIFRRDPGRSGQEGGFGFLTNRNALLFLAAWFVANLLFGVIAQPLGITEGTVAWEAHIGGLVAGLLLFPLIDPHGRSRGPFAGA